MTFDDLWPTLPVPGEYDAMDATDQARWRNLIKQAFEAGQVAVMGGQRRVMTERPILFNGPMVRAILAGTKTQTRRVVKPQPATNAMMPREWSQVMTPRESPDIYGGDGMTLGNVPLADGTWGEIRCPFGSPGDRLWVREAFMHEGADYCWEASVSIPVRPALTVYRADHEGDTSGAGWTPSIHMPRDLSRITLEITGVRVERLQDISYDDAVAEGVEHEYPKAIAQYRDLWGSINGPRSWDANPWVWVIEFRRLVSTGWPR